MSTGMPPRAFYRVFDARRPGGLHPAAPVRQQENRTTPAPGASSQLDATRVEQFLALQRDLLLGTGDPATLPDRLVQSVALFLGVRGAAVSSVEDGRYRVLGA